MAKGSVTLVGGNTNKQDAEQRGHKKQSKFLNKRQVHDCVPKMEIIKSNAGTNY